MMKSCEKIDWKLIATVNTDSILDSIDYETVSKLITSISSCKLELETDIKVNPCFLKVFQLSQNIIKYLLSGQEFLMKQTKDISCELQRVKEEKFKIENDITNKLKRKISSMKSEIKQKEDLILVQSEMLKTFQNQQNSAHQKQNCKSPEQSQKFPCKYCTKVYSSKHFLQLHLARRHSLVSRIKAPPDKNSDVGNNSFSFHPFPQTNPLNSEQRDVQRQMQNIIPNTRDIACVQVTPNFQEQMTELKARLDVKEKENIRLLCLLQEAEKQATDYRLNMMELLQAKKEDKIKKQLKEEFEYKLQLAKEEQEIEHKMQMERLQNSFMHEIKMMHLKQAETSATLENVRKMRLPGNCLGVLEDDNEDDSCHSMSMPEVEETINPVYLQRQKKSINKKNSSGLQEFNSGVALDEVISQNTVKYFQMSNAQASEAQMDVSKQDPQSTKSISTKSEVMQPKNTLSKTNSPLSIQSTKRTTLGQAYTITDKAKLDGNVKSRKSIPPVVLKHADDLIFIKDDLNKEQIKTLHITESKKSNDLSLEEARKLVQIELEQRMLDYGVPLVGFPDFLSIEFHSDHNSDNFQNVHALTYSNYMETIKKINKDIQCLSPEFQAQYVDLRNSIESELECHLEWLNDHQKDLHSVVDNRRSTFELTKKGSPAWHKDLGDSKGVKFPGEKLKDHQRDLCSDLDRCAFELTKKNAGNTNAQISESPKRLLTRQEEIPKSKETESYPKKTKSRGSNSTESHSKMTNSSELGTLLSRESNIIDTNKTSPSSSLRISSEDPDFNNNRNYNNYDAVGRSDTRSTAGMINDFDDDSITTVSECEVLESVQSNSDVIERDGNENKYDELQSNSGRSSRQMKKKERTTKEDERVIKKSTSTVSSIWSSEDEDSHRVEDLDSHRD